MSLITDARAVSLVAKRFEERGFAVSLEPSPETIPFELSGYRPDFLAENEREHILVEVKRSSSNLNTDLLMRISQRAGEQAGWSFQVVTVTDEEMEPDDFQIDPLSSDQLVRLLTKVDQLIGQPSMASFALPLLWSAYVGALQALIKPSRTTVQYTSDLSVLNRAYSLGWISFEELTESKQIRAIRNRVVHLESLDIDISEVQRLRLWVEAALAHVRETEASSRQAG